MISVKTPYAANLDDRTEEDDATLFDGLQQYLAEVTPSAAAERFWQRSVRTTPRLG
ncbi:hypothetical protein [Verrucomicrobium sp. 3C]|uniref:hypothetical protein n=1 Tax=Verrucomicrobium sp. 3C TaxID=1134055 RepID=UPI0003A8DE58|nr:hypothetical protein [Verrucomicrobium sp. 3C]